MHDRLDSLLGDSVAYIAAPGRVGTSKLGREYVVLPAILFDLKYQERLESAVFQRKFAERARGMDLCITTFKDGQRAKVVKIYGAVCVPSSNYFSLTFTFDESKVDIEYYN